MFKKTLGIALLVMGYELLVMSCFAQEEKLTITTYYPSPYGSYNQLYVADKLGIGTNDPYEGIHIKKDIGHLNLQSNTVDEFVDIRFYDADDAYTNPKWSLAYMGSLRGNDLYLDRGIAGTGNNVMTWDYATGNVGIGTTSPDRTLIVGNSTSNEDHAIGIDAPRSNIAAVYFNEAGVVKWGIGRFAGNDDLRFGDATGERMRIQQTTGNVGIGTTTPNSLLDIYTSNTGVGIQERGIRVNRAGSQGCYGLLSYDDVETTYIGSKYCGGGGIFGRFVFRQWNSSNAAIDVLTIDSNSKVGIGETLPIAKLHITNMQPDKTLYVYASSDKNPAVEIINGGGSGAGLRIGAGAAGSNYYPLWVGPYYLKPQYDYPLFWIRGDGAYYHSGSPLSTKESKRDIKVLNESAIGLLKDIQIVTFNYKQDPPGRVRRMGFVANDENHVYDDRLTGNKIGFDVDSIAATLIKATQELQQQIDQLKAENKSLKSEVGALKKSTKLNKIKDRFLITLCFIKSSDRSVPAG